MISDTLPAFGSSPTQSVELGIRAVTSDMQGLERAARLSLGHFEDQPATPDTKSRNLKPAPVLFAVAGGMMLIVALILLAG